MASKQTYTDYANAATQTLVQNWFPPSGPSTWIQTYQDFWHVPNVVTALTRLSKLTGTWNYESTADNAQQMFNSYFYPQQGLPSYYDDECWWGDLFNRLYSLTGASQWNTAANQVFVDLQGGWDDAAKGGVWWKRNPKSYPGNNKGSIENELYMAIAMALYNAPPSDTAPGVYLSATTQTLQWLGNLIDKTGMVWGNLDQNGNINPSNVPRPYTQGVILGALWDLFQQSNLTSYLDTAQQIADAAIANMVWPDGILQDNCEKIGNCGNDQDPILFKGIYARCLGEFAVNLATLSDPARVQAAQRYTAFLQQNADAVWANYPGGTFGMDWHTPSPNYQPTGVPVYDGSLQSQALDLFVSAAIVST